MTSMFSSPVYEQITVTMSLSKHWMLTVPCNTPNAKFWENPVTMMHIEYLVGQEEVSKKTAYSHLQLYLVLKQRKNLKWLKKHIHATAHYERKRGTVAEAIDYCTKDDTRKPNGVRIEIGVRPKEERGKVAELRRVLDINPDAIRDKEDVKKDAQTILERLKTEFVPYKEIPVDVMLMPGFVTAYNRMIRDQLGPKRPNLKIVTIIGPPGCGKSYAISELFPNAGRVMYGNSGIWFCNAQARTMVFEEFMGQITLQNMLKYLDPYPLALEVKGGTEPAFYDLVIITSNTPIQQWYTTADEFKDKPGDPTAATTAKKRRVDALAALHDRLGLNGLMRDCGTVRSYELQPEGFLPIKEQIEFIRKDIMEFLKQVKLDQESVECPKFDQITHKKGKEDEPIEVPSEQDPDEELSPIPELQHPHKTADGLTAEERDLADYMDEMAKTVDDDECPDPPEDVSDNEDDCTYVMTLKPAATAAAAPKRVVVKTEPISDDDDDFDNHPPVYISDADCPSDAPTPKQ